LDLNPLPGHVFTYPLNGLGQEVASSNLLDKTIYLYILPSFTFNYNTAEIIDSSTSVLRHMIIDRNASEDAISFPPGSLILGKINLTIPVVPSMVQCIDTRCHGGGFKDNLDSNTIDKIHPDAMSVFDIGTWDGLPYPCNCVIEVTLPLSVKNKFSEQQIKDILDKYVAFGSYVFIRYE
jgi:hypothetical protein